MATAIPRSRRRNRTRWRGRSRSARASVSVARRSRPARSIATIVTAAAIGAYFVLSHGSTAIATPRNSIMPGRPRLGPPSNRGDYRQRGRDFRVHRERVEEKGSRQRSRRPREGRGAGRTSGDACPPPQDGGRERRHDDQHHDHAVIAAHRKRRHREHRQADRMNGIDLTILPEREIVRLQRSVEVRTIVFAAVVVLDFQIAVVQQALRDDEVMRFVAARKKRRIRHPPRDGAKRDRAREEDDERRSQRPQHGATVRNCLDTRSARRQPATPGTVPVPRPRAGPEDDRAATADRAGPARPTRRAEARYPDRRQPG